MLLDIVKKVGASKVYCQGEATYEEAQVEKSVASALRTENVELKTSWSSTLFDIDALPFKLADLPATHGPQLRPLHNVLSVPLPRLDRHPVLSWHTYSCTLQRLAYSRYDLQLTPSRSRSSAIPQHSPPREYSPANGWHRFSGGHGGPAKACLATGSQLRWQI